MEPKAVRTRDRHSTRIHVFSGRPVIFTLLIGATFCIFLKSTLLWLLALAAYLHHSTTKRLISLLSLVPTTFSLRSTAKSPRKYSNNSLRMLAIALRSFWNFTALALMKVRSVSVALPATFRSSSCWIAGGSNSGHLGSGRNRAYLQSFACAPHKMAHAGSTSGTILNHRRYLNNRWRLRDSYGSQTILSQWVLAIQHSLSPSDKLVLCHEPSSSHSPQCLRRTFRR